MRRQSAAAEALSFGVHALAVSVRWNTLKGGHRTAAREDARPTSADLLNTRLVVNKRALGIAAAVLLFAGLVTLQVVNTSRPHLPPAVTLPDGSTLRLESVSYGKEHFRPGVWWHPLARRLPSDWQRKLKVDTGPAMSTAEPSLGVWLGWDKTNASGMEQWDFGLVDEHGVEVPVQSRSNHGATRAGLPHSLGRVFPVFPRRSSVMTLRFYERKPGGERVQAASFQFPNPVRDKFPEWRPQPMPAVVKQGDLEITFKRLLVGGTANGKPAGLLSGRSQRMPFGSGNFEHRPAASPPGEEAWARAEFDVKETGTPSDVWFPDGIELSDATGNKLRQNSWSSGVQGGTAHLRWRPYLWPSEAAWKIRVEFMRNDKAMFSTNELVVVTGLALPAVDSVTELNLSTNRLGHTVRVLGLTNGKGQFPSRGHSMGGNGTRIEVDVSPELGTGRRLTIMGVRDDQGRKLDSRGAGRGGGSYAFSYEPKPDAKSLDFTLVVQEVVTAEFLVKPELFKPASAAGK